MSTGYYGREMSPLEEQQSKAQPRNDQDPLLALLHDKEIDYDNESDSMGIGKDKFLNSIQKMWSFSLL